VVALVEIPVALLLSVSYVLDRRARRRHRGSVEALSSRPDRPSRPQPRPPSRRGGSNSPGTR
jgi:cytochrome c-type biogenesis protein CcmH/NrfF